MLLRSFESILLWFLVLDFRLNSNDFGVLFYACATAVSIGDLPEKVLVTIFALF